jgi:AcrR family transcriptional regulator
VKATVGEHLDTVKMRPGRPMRKQYHHGDLKNALISAGAELFAQEGVGGLTLRKAARRAGVSHSAPYAHFADKQALVAAISTEGLRIVRERIEEAARRHEGDPLQQLVEAAWETVQFGLEQPDLYRVTFSNAIEREHDYDAYVDMAQRSFDALVRLVESCQSAGVLDPGPPELVAVGLWSLVHGFISLLSNRQIPHRLLDRTTTRRLLLGVLASHLRTPALRGRRKATPAARKRAARRVTRR